MKAIIIDDEIHCREVVESYIEEYCPEINFYDQADSVEAGLEKIRLHNPDLVFLDIQLHNRDSFELLDQLDEIKFKIIFITAFDNYAVRAFQYAALHYLLKPIDPDSFVKAYERCKEVVVAEQSEAINKAKGFYLKTTNQTHNIVFDEVTHIEADGSYSTIYNIDGSDIFASKKIGEIQTILPTHFYRVHNSIIVNLHYVRTINEKTNMVCLSNGIELPISRRRKKEFKHVLQVG